MKSDSYPHSHSHAHSMLLASGSPRRREMLEALGFPLVVRAVDADETLLPGEAATAYLERVVLAKLDLALRLSEANAASCVLVADTIVIARPDETPVILGKPRDDADAQNMIKILSGAIHEVATRFALVMKPVDANLGEAVRTVCRTVTTRVEFRSLDDAAIERYVATGEGRDKAGSYALQGVGATLVRRIEGSHSNVIGLPLCEVVEALERFRAEAGS